MSMDTLLLFFIVMFIGVSLFAIPAIVTRNKAISRDQQHH